ncbi:MAG: type II secretion system major pseudopilin GspG [Bdellovibrionales bacterium]|nr:type II secretion system major pseudopilin GspG [Bdellovibrionales bacterium]
MFKLQLQKRINNERGMTLIEIIIVVTILASLVAILGTRVAGAQRKANVKQARIQIAEISKSLDMYFQDCMSYPDTNLGLAALAPGGEAGCPNWGPEPYIKKVPVDPWGNPFVYYLENGSYTIISYGEDKREGGTGYAADISSND